MNLAISGYTSAGKTTHARLLAAAFGYEFVSAAEILLAELGFDTSTESESEIWFYQNAEIDRRRRGTSIDADLDQLLIARSASDHGIVFDARFLPWLSDTPMVRIWLDSDLPSRARKCCLSVGKSVSDVPECARRIYEKDSLDVGRFVDSHGMVFGPDPDLFDLVIDNSMLIPELDRACADTGIERFHRYLLDALDALGVHVGESG